MTSHSNYVHKFSIGDVIAAILQIFRFATTMGWFRIIDGFEKKVHIF